MGRFAPMAIAIRHWRPLDPLDGDTPFTIAIQMNVSFGIPAALVMPMATKEQMAIDWWQLRQSAKYFKDISAMVTCGANEDNSPLFTITTFLSQVSTLHFPFSSFLFPLFFRLFTLSSLNFWQYPRSPTLVRGSRGQTSPTSSYLSLNYSPLSTLHFSPQFLFSALISCINVICV